MARMKELSAVLDAICDHAQGILEEAEAIRALYYVQDEQTEATVTEPEKTYTLAEVRTALAAKSTAGHRKEVKALLVAHGVEKLTDLDPAEYAAVMAEAEGIGT